MTSDPIASNVRLLIFHFIAVTPEFEEGRQARRPTPRGSLSLRRCTVPFHARSLECVIHSQYFVARCLAADVLDRDRAACCRTVFFLRNDRDYRKAKSPDVTD